MSEQPQRPNPPDDSGSPPSAPPSPDAFTEAGSDVVFDGPAHATDDTPTIISRIQTRPNGQDNLFSGILRGRKLAHFELIESIGVGGMAAVLRARDTQLERIVALKILPPEMAADPENIARFHQEARAAARLDHETVARVYYCGEDQNLHFIAFEFVEGDNLRAIIDRRGQLPVQEALHAMLQVATGLAHAAERGVVHRDIKPSNIIIGPNGRAKLVDMGLARNLGPQTDDGLTQSGVTLGTFDYISPEQALEPRDADVRSDIYSLGCTFYHALTGQAPVPEGTAARKLHHHQHVPPIDPRQLNPDIPNEVAAILSRMMAKDPRHRYQRAEHLVQHILQATQGLNGAQGPGGVLFVDAALPAPPRTRPLLVVGCAAAIVVALVILVGPSRKVPFPGLVPNGNPNSQPENPPNGSNPVGSPAIANIEGSQKPNPVVPESDAPVEVKVSSWSDFEKLKQTFAEAPDKKYKVVVTKDLWRDDGDAVPDVIVKARAITLMGDAPGRTIWSRFVPGDADREGGLVLEAETVQLRELRIVADANTNTNGRGRLAAGVVVRAKQSATFTECEFLQGNWSKSPEAGPFNSVAVASRGAPPEVRFDRCCFLGGRGVKRPNSPGMGGDGWLTEVREGGQTAVAIQGAATVSASDCAFGPHVSLFHFESQNTRLSVRRCTALTGDEWALAHLGAGASTTIDADLCLFGRVTVPALPSEGGMTMMGERKPAVCLVRYDTATRPSDSSYRGTSNRYLNIDAVWLPASGDAGSAATAFADQLLKGGTDEKVLLAAAHPLKSDDPLLLLQGPLSREDLLKAFQLNFNGVPTLVATSNQATVGVGMEKSPWGDPEWTKDDLPVPGGKKVVDPTRSDTARGIYPSLEAALAGAKSGDVIQIRTNDKLAVSQTQLIKAGVSVTIKPDGDSHPILVLDEAPDGPQAALFRVQGGQLNLESLEFRLRPNPKGSGFDSQAVVLLGGDGTVAFKDCVVTLDGRDATLPLAVVMLPDYKEAMVQPGSTGMPKIVFDTCFVRGDGDLVSARASRPFEMDVKESLIAVKGSLLTVDAGSKESSAAVWKESKESVRLDRVTAYLGGHLARLKAINMTSLMPVHFTPVKSLLVSAGDRKALLHVEAGPTKDPEAARGLLPWKGDGNNYANFSTMLDQQPGENEGPFPATTEKWKASDNESKSDDVKFPERLWPDPSSEVALAEVTPSAFDLKSGPKGVGVNTRLPLPSEH